MFCICFRRFNVYKFCFINTRNDVDFIFALEKRESADKVELTKIFCAAWFFLDSVRRAFNSSLIQIFCIWGIFYCGHKTLIKVRFRNFIGYCVRVITKYCAVVICADSLKRCWHCGDSKISEIRVYCAFFIAK